jgi:protein SCO1/2
MSHSNNHFLPNISRLLYAVLYLSLTAITNPLLASSSANTDSATTKDPHAHHRAMMKNNINYKKSYSAYVLPQKILKDKNNSDVNLHRFLHGDKPFIMSFIFTTCTTICPVLTATLSSAQDVLMASPVKPVLISISIDPEVDTPDKLTTYAKKFKASEDWIFLTGKLDDIIEVQRSLGIYRGSKLNHEPVTLMKMPGKKWLVLNGFTSANDLVKEYRLYSNDE